MLEFVGAMADKTMAKVNEAIQETFDKDSDKGADLEALADAVPSKWRDLGLEFFGIKSTQYVLHQKLEVVEIFENVVDIDLPYSLETPNTYAIRDPFTGITYYSIKERAQYSQGFDWYMRSYCRGNAPIVLDVVNMRSKEKVAEITSPWAVQHCCCGIGCLKCHPCCCIVPACCNLRQVTWNAIVRDENGTEMTTKPIATVYEQLGCCKVKQYPVIAEDNSTPFVMRNQNFFSCFFGDCDTYELDIFRNKDDKDRIGRVWGNYWKEDYVPTNSRYKELKKPESISEVLTEAFQVAAKEIFSDADSYMIECPTDNVPDKVALMTSSIMHDYLHNEN